MSNPYDPTPEQYAEAAEWLYRLREPGPSVTRQFEAWKARSLAHEFAFAEIEVLFETSAPVVRDAAAAARRAGRLGPSGRTWRHAAAPLMAAGVAALFAVGVMTAPELRALGHDAATAPGRQRTVTLDDGTRVTLNTGTVIDWPREGRGATLVRGEAYFEVAKDPANPFVVLAGPSRVRVLGTKFSVRLDRDMAVVGVDEGRVSAGPRLQPERAVMLTAGEEGLVQAGAAQEQALDPTSHAAWRRDQLVFYGAPLRRVVAELNRYRRTPIVISDGTLADKNVTGVFSTADTDQAVDIIQRTLGARVARGPLGLTVIY